MEVDSASQSQSSEWRQEDGGVTLESMDDRVPGGAASASPAAAAGPTTPTPTGRPAIHHQWTDTATSSSTPITATRFVPLTPEEYAKSQYGERSTQFEHGVPIVVDNGSYDFRAGFATDADPRLVYRSLIGRPRNRRDADFVLVGPHLIEGDQYAPQRIKVRSPFDQTLVTHFDLMEYLFDFTFSSLGLTASVPHPVYMTEPLGNPNYCRSKMSELLFECYGVPGIGYGLGELLSWRFNAGLNGLDEGRDRADGDVTGDALIVSCGYESSTIMPVIDSTPVFAQCSRLSVGGAHLANYLTHSLTTIQHPQHQAQFNGHRVQQLVEQYGQVAPDSYNDRLQQMALLYDVNHAPPSHLPLDSTMPDPVTLQLPFVPPTEATSSTAELQLRIERKELQRQRLRNLMADRKEKKLVEDQAILADWDAVRNEFQQKLLTPSEYLRQLKRRTFADEQDFIAHYDKLKKSVTARLSGEKPEDVAAAAEADRLAKLSLPETELYPLLFRQDSELTPDELKEKSKQKRLRSMSEVQLVKRREKEARLLAEKEARALELQEFEANPTAFIENLQKQKEAILASREERIRTESDATGRRSAAAKKRMSLLATMGGSGGSIESIEKMARKDKAGFQREANFGMRDEDWKVYDEVRHPAEAGAGKNADSEDEREALTKIESKLAHYDPNGTSVSKSPLSILSASDFQVPLWVDRVRLPEFFFQPTALLGLDEAGLSEMIRRALVRLPTEHATRVAKHIFVCGGSTQFPNFLTRIENEVRQIRPTDSELRVAHARHPQWDAWRGAARMCNSTPFSRLFFTRSSWLENGADYLLENAVSNVFMATPPDEAPELARKRKR